MAIEVAGHRLRVRELPTAKGGWFAICTCGWVGRVWALQRFAVGSAAGHLTGVKQELRKAGLDFDGIAAMTRHLEGSTKWPDEGLSDEEVIKLLNRWQKGNREASTRSSQAISTFVASRSRVAAASPPQPKSA